MKSSKTYKNALNLAKAYAKIMGEKIVNDDSRDYSGFIELSDGTIYAYSSFERTVEEHSL